MTGPPTRHDQMIRAVHNSMARMRSDTGISDPEHDQFRTVRRFVDFTEVTADIHEVLCKGIPVAQVNLEIAVPLGNFARAQRSLATWHEAARPRLHYPVILRATGPSAAWLSPAHGKESVYFGFVVYLGRDGCVPDHALRYLAQIQELLAAEGGRPHWGKYFDVGAFDLRSAYARWDEFSAVRRAMDPAGRFENEFVRSVFGSVTADVVRAW